MAAELIFALEAEQDVNEAYDWYEKSRIGLGEEFLSCIEACVERICRTPELYANVHEDCRRALVTGGLRVSFSTSTKAEG